MAKTTMIKATSRASVKVKDSFYTLEYGEERMVNDGDDLIAERADLWNTVNHECDMQIVATLQSLGLK